LPIRSLRNWRSYSRFRTPGSDPTVAARKFSPRGVALSRALRFLVSDSQTPIEPKCHIPLVHQYLDSAVQFDMLAERATDPGRL